MKKYLLTLCLTMLAFVSSWAQGTGRWEIEVSTAPVYVEVNEGQVDPSLHQNPQNRDITIKTPDGAIDYTVEAVEMAPAGVTEGTIASVVVTGSGTSYVASFSPKVIGSSVGITRFYIQIRNSLGTIVSTTAATPFEVNVYDKTKARILKAPAEYNTIVPRGKTTEIPFTLAPVTALLEIEFVEQNSHITIPTLDQWVKDAENNIVKIPVTIADDATLNESTTLTLKPEGNPLDRDGNPVQPITFQITVGLEELPVKYENDSREFRVGQTFKSPLEIKDDYKEEIGSNYTEQYVRLAVPGYAEDVVTINDQVSPQTLTTHHAGLAQVKGTLTPTGDMASVYRAWSRVLNISVIPAEYGLSFEVEKNGDTWRPTNKNVTIFPTPNAEVVDPNDNTDNSKYTITYSIEGALPNTATVDEHTGEVTILSSETSQKFNLVATLTPNNTHDFVGAKATAQISVEGSVKGAYLEKQADGKTWTAYLASPGETGDNIVAKFEVRSKVPGEESRAPWDLLSDLRNTGEVINVSGNINVFNIAQLAHAMGVEETVKYSGTMKTLDMSGCQMVGPFTIDGNFPVTGVNVEYKDNGGTVVHTDGTRAWHKLSFKNVEKFVFPQPDPNYTVLPAGFHKFFGNEYNPADNNLTSLSFPEGWTEIEDGFSGLSKAAHYTTSAMAHLTELKLANTLEKIGAYAFSDLKVEVLTMPYNIHRIDDHAFNMSSKLQDVYFTGPAPEFVHTFAFAGVSQMCNNTVVNDTEILNGKVDPVITRYPYTNNGILGCLLHFPEQYRSSYTDETRVYRRLTEEEATAQGFSNANYEKGGKLYKPAGWTDTFISAVNNRSPKDPNADIPGPWKGINYGAKDQYYGEDMVWPSQDELESGYAIAQAGYQWSGQTLRSTAIDGKPIQYQPSATYENEGVDRRGLYQFIVAMGNADINFKFISDLWYTITLPFNMSIDDIKAVFGPKTQVCRFSKVTRVTEDGNKQIKLEFRKSVMYDMTGEYDGTNYNDYVNPYPNDLQAAEYSSHKYGIIHHFPYMIKPSGTTENKYVEHTTDGNGNSVWTFKGLDFPRIQGTLHPEQIKPANDASHPGYIFAPILSKNRIKPNSYILVERTDKPQIQTSQGAAYRHEYVFYKGKKNATGEYEAGGAANQNTAYVQLPIEAETADGNNFTYNDWGKKELDVFFTKKTDDPSGAKYVKTFFGDDLDDEEEEEATQIEKVVIVCGQDQVDDEKIYSISGQLMSGSHLPAGIYIKNGKKYIVK